MEVLTKRQIGLLGDRIREAYGDGSGKISDADLKLLQDYRLSFRETIATIFDIVYQDCQNINKKCIVTYRIKRIESIIGKLERMPTTQLDRLGDIAGCRCIFSNNDQVYRLLEKLKANNILSIRKIKDYIQESQPEGYKSIHLYVSLADGDGKQVEIQIRNQEQHNWATLVEITDFIFETKLKEYKEPEDLLEFHRILSIPEQKLTESERKHFFSVIKKRDYINRINEVFVKNYINVRMQWMQIQYNSKNNFYLIEAKRDNNPQIDSYVSFTDAENAYFERFQQSNNSNIVLTNIPDATYEQVSIAYSNYMLSTHQFSDDCLNRYQGQIRKSLEHKNLNYARYYYRYCEILACSLKLLQFEIDTLNSSYSAKDKHKIKVKDWIKDIDIKIRKLVDKRKKLTQIYKNTLNSADLFYLYCSIVTKVINRKYSKMTK